MIRLNVGLSRKIGQANYGSKGGSVNLEVEVADLDHTKLRESIHKLFSLASSRLRMNSETTAWMFRINQLFRFLPSLLVKPCRMLWLPTESWFLESN